MTPEEAIEAATLMLKALKGSGEDLVRYRELLQFEAVGIVDGPAKNVVAELLCGGDRRYLAYDDAKGTTLIVKAESGNADAHAVLCKIAAELIARGTPLPPNLRWYICRSLTKEFEKPPPKKQDAHREYDRNHAIVSAIRGLCRHGFKPTRNRESETHSASSIVQQALERLGIHDLTVSGVEKVWQNRDKWGHPLARHK